jgi:ATP synthase F1 complex assembly factor 1
MFKSLIYKGSRSFAFTYPCPRKLREIMKLSAIEREMPHTIKDLWTQYHKAKSENIAESLSKTEYEGLRKKYNVQHFI